MLKEGTGTLYQQRDGIFSDIGLKIDETDFSDEKRARMGRFNSFSYLKESIKANCIKTYVKVYKFVCSKKGHQQYEITNI